MPPAVRAAKTSGGPIPIPAPSTGHGSSATPLNAPQRGIEEVPKERLRWSSWAKALNGERLVSWVRDEVFAFYGDIARDGVTNFMDGARLVIDEPTVLAQVLTRIRGPAARTGWTATRRATLFEHVPSPDQASR